MIKEEFNDLFNSAYVTDSANGSIAHFVEVEYRADTKLYIDKRLAEVTA